MAKVTKLDIVVSIRQQTAACSIAFFELWFGDKKTLDKITDSLGSQQNSGLSGETSADFCRGLPDAIGEPLPPATVSSYRLGDGVNSGGKIMRKRWRASPASCKKQKSEKLTREVGAQAGQ